LNAGFLIVRKEYVQNVEETTMKVDDFKN